MWLLSKVPWGLSDIVRMSCLVAFSKQDYSSIHRDQGRSTNTVLDQNLNIGWGHCYI
jgi:hypothetical protein